MSRRNEKLLSAQHLPDHGVLIAQRQRKHSLKHLLFEAVFDPRRVTVVGEHPGDGLAAAQTLFGLAPQNRPSVAGEVVGAELDVDGRLGEKSTRDDLLYCVMREAGGCDVERGCHINGLPAFLAQEKGVIVNTPGQGE